MKRFLLLAAAALSLSACGDGLSESQITKALTAEIGDKPYCWALQKPADLPVRVDAYSLRDPIIAGLQRSGLVEIGAGNWGAAEVRLTPKGEAAKVYDRTSGFCVGRREVVSASWTEPQAVNGTMAAQIEYRWRLVDKPSWLDEGHFADVPGVAGEVKGMAAAVKMNDGWKVANTTTRAY